MSALAKPAMTLADFLAWEAQQPERHEFVDGEIFAMVGASLVHGMLVNNLGRALEQQLPRQGRVFREGYKVLAGPSCLYPDVILMCDPIRRNDLAIERPLFIAEVLSDSSELYDRGRKWSYYREGLASLHTYMLVSKRELLVEVYRRHETGWHYTAHRDLTDAIDLQHPPCRVTLADIYQDALDLLGEGP